MECTPACGHCRGSGFICDTNEVDENDDIDLGSGTTVRNAVVQYYAQLCHKFVQSSRHLLVCVTDQVQGSFVAGS